MRTFLQKLGVVSMRLHLRRVRLCFPLSGAVILLDSSCYTLTGEESAVVACRISLGIQLAAVRTGRAIGLIQQLSSYVLASREMSVAGKHASCTEVLVWEWTS